MFMAQPKKYGLTDILEDLPGPARAVTPIIKDVLPSQVIISKDPVERRHQIAQAVARIKATRDEKSGLGKKVLSGAKDLGLAAFLPSLGIAGLFKLLGARSPMKKLPAGGSKWQSPIAPVEAIRNMIKTPGLAREAAKETLHEGLLGAGLGAAHGALVPLVSRGYRVSDKSLEDAQKVMEEQPQLTSLPAAGMLSVLKNQDLDRSPPQSRKAQILTNSALGAGLGLASGVSGAFLPAAVKALGYGAKNILTRRPITEGIAPMLRQEVSRDASNAAKWGAGLGLVSGAFTKKLDENTQTPIISDKA